MKYFKLIFILLALSLVAGVVSAQSGITDLRVQLSWVHEYSGSGFYMAGAEGHYAAENLNVELMEGGPTANGLIDPLEKLANGEADFALTNLQALLRARAAGQPFVGIAAITVRSPLAVISLPEKGIVTPEDLPGLTIAGTDASIVALQVMMHTLQIDDSTITIVPRSGAGVDQLVNGEVDARLAWVITDGVTLESMGIEPNYIIFADYGIDTYDLMLVTTEDMIANNPETVQGFVRATLQGYADLIDEPGKAAEITVSYHPEVLNYDDQLKRINAFLPLIKPAGSEIGVLSPEVFEYNQQMLVDAGVLEAPLDDLTAAYDLSFLETIYGEAE